jgi:hypothetical protein
MPKLAVDVVEPASLRVAGLTTDGVEGDRTWKVAFQRALPAGMPVTLRFPVYERQRSNGATSGNASRLARRRRG